MPEKPHHLLEQQLPKPTRLRPILMFHFHPILLPRRAFPPICASRSLNYFVSLDSSSTLAITRPAKPGRLSFLHFPSLLLLACPGFASAPLSRHGRAFGSSPAPHDCRRTTSPSDLIRAALATRPVLMDGNTSSPFQDVSPGDSCRRRGRPAAQACLVASRFFGCALPEMPCAVPPPRRHGALVLLRS